MSENLSNAPASGDWEFCNEEEAHPALSLMNALEVDVWEGLLKAGVPTEALAWTAQIVAASMYARGWENRSVAS